MVKIPLVRGAAKRIARAAGVMPPKNGAPLTATAYPPLAQRRGLPALTDGSMEGLDRPSTSSSYEDTLDPWMLEHMADYAEDLPEVRQRDLEGFFYIPLRLERHFHREEYEYDGKKCVHIALESDLEHKALEWNKWRIKAGKGPYWPIVKPHNMTERAWLASKPLAGLDPGRTKLYILLNKLKGNQSNSDPLIGGYEAPVSRFDPGGWFSSGQRLWNAEAFAKHLQQAGLDQDYRFIRFYIPFSAYLDNEWAEKFARHFVKEMDKLGYRHLSVRGYRGEVSLDYKKFPNGDFHRYSRRLIAQDQWDEKCFRPKQLSFEINSWDIDNLSTRKKTVALAKKTYKNAKKKITKATGAVTNEATSQLMRYGLSYVKKRTLG